MKTVGLLGMMFLGLLVVAGSVVAANTGIVKIDRVSCLWGGNQLLTGGDPRFDIRLTNNTGQKVSIGTAFRIFSPDGAVWYQATIDTLYDEAIHRSAFAAYFSSLVLFQDAFDPYNSATPDTIGAIGFAPLGAGVPDGYDNLALQITLLCPRDEVVNDSKTICIDSVSTSTAQWKWFGNGTEFVPEFQASSGVYTGTGYCWQFYHLPCYASSTAVSPSSCATCACCISRTGNVNMTGIVDLADLSLLINYLTATSKPALPCEAEANVNKTGIIDLSDLSFLIAYLTGSPRPELPLCP